MIDLSIIIVNWNTAKLLRVCLTSVFQYTKGLDYEVIVVDNGSSDASVRSVNELFASELKKKKQQPVNPAQPAGGSLTRNKLIKNKNNLGFAKANNQGIKVAKGQYILLLNSDTRIDQNAFAKLIEFADQKDNVGILGPKLINPGKQIQRSVGSFYTLPVVFLSLFGFDRFLRRAPSQARRVDWVEGSCFLVKKAVFDQVGRLDEKFFMYVEEMEFCYRARQLADWQTWYYPQAAVHHLVRGSSPEGEQKAIKWIHEGLRYFYQKHFAGWQRNVLECLLRFKEGLCANS